MGGYPAFMSERARERAFIAMLEEERREIERRIDEAARIARPQDVVTDGDGGFASTLRHLRTRALCCSALASPALIGEADRALGLPPAGWFTGRLPDGSSVTRRRASRRKTKGNGW